MKLIKGIVGSALLVSSAILFATKYIVAVFGNFGSELKYMPIIFDVIMCGTVVIGIFFIVQSLIDESLFEKK
ncbi:MAG: hypothetical protein RSC95_01440 [Anaerovoracaceae bacterium]